MKKCLALIERMYYNALHKLVSTGGVPMAKKEQIKETASKNDLEKVLKSTINEMHKLNVPDAEIMNNIKRLMDNLYDEKSTMRRYKH